jgi:hypothetical protein
MLAALALMLTTAPQLVAHWSGNGTFEDSVTHQVAQGMGGVVFVPGPFGKAFDLGGEGSVIYVPDSDRFKITEALTLSCWIRLRHRPENGSSSQAQIIFRGDDRTGLDPYRLDVSNNMQWQFAIDNEQNHECLIGAPAVLNEWTHLCGTWDGATGQMRLYVNGELASSTTTDIKPLRDLDMHYNPAVSLGNVQNPYGPSHFQPLDASLAEVKIYRGALDKPDYVLPKQ